MKPDAFHKSSAPDAKAEATAHSSPGAGASHAAGGNGTALGTAAVDRRTHVVILGGGFAGLAAAEQLADRDVRVTLIDKRNFHLFQPLLYQVATGALSPGDIATPLREVLRSYKNITVLLGEATDIDVRGRRVLLSDGEIGYDFLLVAVGFDNNYFGHPDWERWAPGLKSLENATELRSRILHAFESAEREPDRERRRALLTFVVVGAGPTGVEMAGAIAEFAADTMAAEFRHIARDSVNVVLIEGGERVLSAFPGPLSLKAEKALRIKGVTVRTRTVVRSIDAEGVSIDQSGLREKIAARVVVWGAGVGGTALVARLAAATGADLTKAGGISVGPDLTVPGHPEIFVAGDTACFHHRRVRPLPGVAQVAMQQGRYVAGNILAWVRQDPVAREPFRYKDRGSMATIGRAEAVADLGRLQLSGWWAWVAWLFIHLMSLVTYENRVLVLIQWAWYYVWRRRSARLITTRHDATSREPASGETRRPVGR